MDVRNWGRVDYVPTYEAMQAFTATRNDTTPDALWIAEHRPSLPKAWPDWLATY